MEQRAGQVRPGGRTARTTAAVHDAVRALVVEGAEPVSIAQVATRAGVNPATLYRRWGSREALLLEVAVDELNDRSALTPTGDLRADLEAYGNGIVSGLRSPGGMPFLSAIMAAARSPETGIGAALALVGRRLELVQTMLGASDAGGSLTPMDVVDGLVGPIYFRVLVAGPGGATDDDVVRLVDNLLAVAAHRRSTGASFPASWPGEPGGPGEG